MDRKPPSGAVHVAHGHYPPYVQKQGRRMTKIAGPAAILVALLTTASVWAPAMAQGQPGNGGFDGYDRAYEDGFRAGYRGGFDDGRQGRRYDDRPILRPEPQPAPPTRRPPPPPFTNGSPQQPPPFAGAPQPPPVPPRDGLWRGRYGDAYTFNDDFFYRECRMREDPAGIVSGSVIGGLPGRGNGPAFAGGVILSGAYGAALTQGLDCADRSYAYRAYYDGLNSTRQNSIWGWRNPRNGHYGDFLVGEYYADDDGFRCATFSQRLNIGGRQETAMGHACQQPDGSWTIVP
jgi:surface antigen